jgi:photosystem II stability/assembly factor-like uncharacterized protein
MRLTHSLLLSFVTLLTVGVADLSFGASTAPWLQVSRLTDGPVDSVVFDSAHPDAGLIYRSQDGGASWKPVSVGTVVEGFRAIAVSPTKPGTIYAYSSDNFFGGSGTLYRSVNDGLSWAPLPHQPSSAVTGSYFAGVGRGIAIDPTGTILVLTDAFSGVLRSSDGGETWTNPVPNAATYGLAASPTQAGVLWVAGLDYVSGLPSIWKSTDFGATWTVQTPAAFNPPGVAGAFAYAITVQPGTGTILANWSGFDPATFALTGGMVISTDDGLTWNSSNVGLLPTYSPGNSAASIAFDPAQPATVYLSTNGGGLLDGGGFYVSHDSGASWQPSGDRIRTLGGFTVAARPAQPGYPAAVFVGYNDLFISTDHAITWARSDTGLNNGFAQNIQDDGLNPPGLYAATGDGLFHTTNGGHDWTRINNWSGFDGIGRVAVDLNSAARTVFAASVNHVWKSTNAGGSWSDVTPPATAGTVFDEAYSNPIKADEVFVVAHYGTFPSTHVALFHSSDAGQTWSNPSCDIEGDDIVDVLVAHTPPGRLYVARESGLWISDDAAANCAPAAVQPLPGGFVWRFAEAGINPTALLVSGVQPDGTTVVMRSIDAGASYLPVATLPGSQFFPPWNLSSSPDLQVALAVDLGSMIAVSRDGGATWTMQPETLFPVSAGAAFLSPTRSNVFWGDISGALYSAPYGALH